MTSPIALLVLVAQVADPALSPPPVPSSWPWWAQFAAWLVPVVGGWLGVSRLRRRSRAKPCPPTGKPR